MAGERMSAEMRRRLEKRMAALEKRLAADPEYRAKIAAPGRAKDKAKAEREDRIKTAKRVGRAQANLKAAKKRKADFEKENRGLLKARKRGQAFGKAVKSVRKAAQKALRPGRDGFFVSPAENRRQREETASILNLPPAQRKKAAAKKRAAKKKRR